MDDLISRADVLALTKDIVVPTPTGEYRYRCIDPQEAIELQPAQPQPESCFNCEHRIEIDCDIMQCSLIKEMPSYSQSRDSVPPFCPLPPLQPRKMKGHWINEGRTVRCSQCQKGYNTVKGMRSAMTYNFCPNCNADMREEQK